MSHIKMLFFAPDVSQDATSITLTESLRIVISVIKTSEMSEMLEGVKEYQVALISPSPAPFC